MLIKEVRQIIKGYSEEELRVLIAEMYKKIPKKVREEKYIDELVEDINCFKNASKSVRKMKREEVDLFDLEMDIDEFVDYAYQQYYFAPNSYVHKKERPKWRFKVMKFIKELDKVYGDDEEDIALATELLKKLYEVLCYGYYYVLFSGDDPFSSIQMEQEEVFAKLVAKYFIKGVNKETITEVLKIMAGVKPETSLINEVQRYLTTPDLRKIGIIEAELLRRKLVKGNNISDSRIEKKKTESYYLEEKNNILVEFVFFSYFELAEYERACNYFNDYYKEYSEEVKLYILLRNLANKGYEELWLKEYEKAEKKKIKPRQSLQELYQYLKKNGKFPERY